MTRPDTFIAFDLETTGLSPTQNEIIEIGAVRVTEGEVTDTYSRLVRPIKPLPPFITHLTGITEEDLADAPGIQEVLPSFFTFIEGYPLVGQNVGFDVGFIRAAAGAGSLGPAIDTIDMARVFLPRLPSYSLDSLIDVFGIDPGNRHRALDDARVTAIVYLKLLTILRNLPGDYAGDLAGMAARGNGALAEVFQSHLRERIEHRVKGTPKEAVSAAIPRENNLYGDFGMETPKEPTGDAIDVKLVQSLFTADGILAREHPGFEERSGQVQLAGKIAEAFNDAELLLAEAGTGTGKSVAYLAPAIIWAETTRERVIISTNTKNLQEQLFTKDIPLLGRVLEFPFRAVILKGRGNYICLRRWQQVRNQGDRYLSGDERGLLLPVTSWLNETLTGDLSETGFFPLLSDSGLLEKINSDSPLCLGARCPEREQCFVSRVRRAAQQAHVIIVNHSLVFSDMAAEGGVLGGYSRIIFDEAHNIERVATRYLGVTLSQSRVRRVLNRLYSTSDGTHGHLAILSDWMTAMVRSWPEFAVNEPFVQNAITGVGSVRTCAGVFFDRLALAVRADLGKQDENREGKLRYFADCPVFDACREVIDQFQDSLHILCQALSDVSQLAANASPSQLDRKEELVIELAEVQASLMEILNDLAFLMEATGKNVFWFEISESTNYLSVRLQSAPLDIDEKLAYGLYDRMETVVMTSATLTVARNFSYIRRRLGLDLDTRERIVECIADSPFDYPSQAAVILPAFLPSPKDPGFIDATNNLIGRLGEEINRGMLVLFTSRGHLMQTYHALKDRFTHAGIILLAQDVDGSRSAIIRRFKEETRSILFGTDSFWEGVDVPGAALEVVVISRIPFAVPTDPIVAAHMEEIERNGGNPFFDLSIPEAAIKLRQGAGRLIRHRSDRGAVIICDTRILTTRYGSQFRQSLPGSSLRADTPDTVISQIKTWFDR